MKALRISRGFSLTELLVVVAIIGIIAAIAIPNLLAERRSANEASARASLLTIWGAQATYQATTGAGSFAPDLATLRSVGLVDTSLGEGKKNGYEFAVVEQSGSLDSAVFGAQAFPLAPHGVMRTGSRRYGLTEDGVLWVDSVAGGPIKTRADILALPNRQTW